ncbi:hypothetical protein BK138_34465 [Paenibacillus rhizosphaerae]|uniref:Conjugal transfer protein n=1 Tax=Paenibacillus rhizosphaerae TaxID=297318 RepID=A0A1R1DYU5_9BACL|nr:hypothetical protein [Paenibacillus rhizosphaerae]OMF44747.1 hypothetical protein BK138_34465 [Paenibacillus rhizosphaerae]
MNFGENLQSELSTQLGALFLLIIGVLAVFFLIKREFSKFIGFFVFALVVSVFVFVPDKIKDLGTAFWDKIFS